MRASADRRRRGAPGEYLDLTQLPRANIGPALPLRARAKSALRGLTCGFGGQQPQSSLLSQDCALDLHGQHSAPAQVRAT